MCTVEELRSQLESFITKRDRDRESFLNRFDRDPSNAIANYSAGLASSEETARLAQITLEIADSDQNEMDLVDATNYIIKCQQRNIDRHVLYPPSSSSQFSNLVDIYKRQGLAVFIDELTGLGGVLGYINDQREREEQGQKNEAIFEIFKSQKRNLLYTRRAYVQTANGAKNKRDKLANETGADAVDTMLHLLKNKAESYGLGERLAEVTINSY